MARRPLWLWPNLLSLDAPLVAVAWFWMFKQVWGVVSHYATLPWLLAVAVWCIYVADRLLDERMAELGSRRGTPRHEFHRCWRRPLTVALLVGVVASLGLLYLQARGLIKFGTVVLVPVGAYFVMAFYDSGRGVSHFKNTMAGLAFAYGTAVGVHFHSRESGDLPHLVLSQEVLTFGVLCILNMTAIDSWEEERAGDDPVQRNQLEAALTLLLLILAIFALVFAVRAEHFGLQVQYKAFYVSIMVAAAALQVLNRMRSRFSLDALRALADVAMLLPLPIFYAMVKFAEQG